MVIELPKMSVHLKHLVLKINRKDQFDKHRWN